MAKLLYTVTNLVDEVRSQIDEANVDSIDTNLDILPALNRANDFAFDIYARLYPDPILQHSTLALIGDQAEYDMPENIFEDRVLKLEIMIPSGSDGKATYREVQQISYRDLSLYESASKTNVPYYWCIIGRKIRFVPTPTGTYPARMWSLRQVEKLVLPQGRINTISSNYVLLDEVGDSLTTEVDQLSSYVNVIDGQTGEIKGTCQIQLISGSNKVTFRTSPLRTSVLNRTVTDLASVTGIAPDDYLCSIEGTCVPYYSTPTSNFLIQYTAAELVRKLGGDSDKEEKVLQKFEQQVERTWARRETTLRVKKRSQNWGVPVRRWEWE